MDKFRQNEQILHSLIASLEKNKGQITKNLLNQKSLLQRLTGELAKRDAITLVTEHDGDKRKKPLLKMQSPLVRLSH